MKHFMEPDAADGWWTLTQEEPDGRQTLEVTRSENGVALYVTEVYVTEVYGDIPMCHATRIVLDREQAQELIALLRGWVGTEGDEG